MTNLTEREQWFVDQIGKRVYVNRPIHLCEKCEKAFREGYFISDERSAIDLAETEERYTTEGLIIRFFDTKEDALKFQYENPVVPKEIDLGTRLKTPKNYE